MKFSLDTANLNEIREAAALGLVDGVTTNPSLVAKERCIRHPIHVIEAARLEADVATMPFKVMAQLINHPLTEKGFSNFLPIGARQLNQFVLTKEDVCQTVAIPDLSWWHRSSEEEIQPMTKTGS